MDPNTNAASRLADSPAGKEPVQDVFIISAARTPTARANGSFVDISAPQLGAHAIKDAVRKSNIPVSKISTVYMGNVLQGGVGQSPARQASIFAGLPVTVDAITVNKVCASGLKAVVLAAQDIQVGVAEVQVAGGMENMSRAPYYLAREAMSGRGGGDVKLEDGRVKDGLWDVYNQIHMGSCGEIVAKRLGITREVQDEYAIRSFERAQKAWAEGKFTDEIVPVPIPGKTTRILDRDEGYDKLQRDKITKLRPAFAKDGEGTITAANSSSINDGASALVLGNREMAQRYGKGSRVLSRLVSWADAGLDPVDFPIAPAKAIQLALSRAGIRKEDVAVWEMNEAFAAVIKANEQILGLEGANINPLGGAISLGHALGSSGSRILTTLVHQLQPGQYGVAAICNGGGAATAVVVQRIEGIESVNGTAKL
ncbi:Putative Acetyl-CoA C-acetyltransferase [Aspergillus calidoustus]|uniref:acetyl-CoA C-acetyltransferase n=1 Tax=Aspergillus calidoustus TaxID=454130 RepID=A0A0U5CJX9_ASPCI|nr:Putative Acetyl-CoA C-acetyltransferase [Aspergillus calidoustus]